MHLQITPGFPNLSVMGTMAPLSRVDLPMNELDHPTTSKTEVNNEWSRVLSYTFAFTALEQ
jgi:hypothetical protein